MENHLEKSDEELALGLLEDQSCLLALMRRYENRLLAYIFRLSNFSREEAEDILQDVFIKMYKNINSFDDSLKFSSWIYRITHNEVIDNFRKNKRRPQASDDIFDEDIINRIVEDFDIEKELDRGKLKEALFSFLDKIDNKYREVLILKFVEEKDYREISDILKKPMGSVATLINRAKKRLKAEIEKNDKNLNQIL